jgi:APA family basic amino acid/polyamine antiporter
MPGWASTLHPRFRTPWISNIIIGIFVAVLASVISLDVLDQLVSIGTLFAFVIVCAGVWVLRLRHPHLKRPFKTPWVPFVPIMGILVSATMMASLPAATWLRLIVWLIVGMAVYFGYGRHHSRVQARLSRSNQEQGG